MTPGAAQDKPRKRRRTTKACTNCRRRKVRCNGEQPCEACYLSDNLCSYDGDRRRMTSTAYISALEKKVTELETLLSQENSPAKDRHSNLLLLESSSSLDTESNEDDSNKEFITTMIDANNPQPAGSTVENSTTNPEFYPSSFGGLSLLRRVHDLCRRMSGMQLDPSADTAGDDLAHSFDVEPLGLDSSIPWEAFALLPPKNAIEQAIDVVLDQACCNLQFLDKRSLRETANEIYHNIETEDRHHARKPLALLYSVLALARRFKPSLHRNRDTAGQGIMNGLRYFRASRAMLDPADCRDIFSLQALLCMILYMQSSSMMSTCYSYICMAVAASLQMGFFTDAASVHLPEHERLCRRRIFAVLYIMDAYVTTALGLPRTLRDVDPSHALPLVSEPNSIHDSLVGTYLHAQLIQILALTVETNHPVTRPIEQQHGFYGVEYSKIVATEYKLETWFNKLPVVPAVADTSSDASLMRSQLLLRLYYAHVQIVLYRPFMHHTLKDVRRDSCINLKAYACGSACIKAAMQVVWLVERMEACNLFSDAHWFITLILANTSTCLALFVLNNDKDPTLTEIVDAMNRIRKLCVRYATESVSMQRCLKFLESISPRDQISTTRSNLDAWSNFNQNLSMFSEAYRHSDGGLDMDHNFPGGDLMEALNLPQFQPLLNNRM